MKIALVFFILSLLLACQPKASGDVLYIAVASNFYVSAKQLSVQFSEDSGIEVKLSAGSTGQLFTQISQGAPFDVFLSADVARPLMLEQQNITVPGSRFTYASGRLVVWSLLPFDTESVESIISLDFDHLAIANPNLAPYGVAAEQAMKYLNVYDEWQGRLVLGQNVAQAQQFVVAGQAQFAIISWAQALLWQERHNNGHFLLLPESSHTPIAQQAVQIKSSKNADAFMLFLKSQAVKEQLESKGYKVGRVNTDMADEESDGEEGDLGDRP